MISLTIATISYDNVIKENVKTSDSNNFFMNSMSQLWNNNSYGDDLCVYFKNVCN